MSEKLCLQWNDFRENITTAFGSLRHDNDLSDVTLVCEDGEQVEAHKVILSASSPFFQRILKRNKHPNPMIFMRGLKPQDLVAMVDFIYFGEANINQESLESFLVLAEEVELKGLTRQNASDFIDDDYTRSESIVKLEEFDKKVKSTPKEGQSSNIETDQFVATVEAPTQFRGGLEELDLKVKSMMTKIKSTEQNGKQIPAYVCNICGREGRTTEIKNHIERNHLEGVSVQCTICDKTFRSRNAMYQHKGNVHNNKKSNEQLNNDATFISDDLVIQEM